MSYINRSDLNNLGYDIIDLFPTTNTSTLDDICLRASRAVDAHCRYSMADFGNQFAFGSGTVTEQFDELFPRNGYYKLFPNLRPVTAVNSINLVYSPSNIQPYNANQILINNSNHYLDLYCAAYETPRHIEINYDYGYETVPDDIAKAALAIAKSIIDDIVAAEKTDFSSASQIKDGARTVNIQRQVVVPQEAINLLIPYVRTLR